MNRKELDKKFKNFIEEFWNIDCLIRILKELSSEIFIDSREDDIYTISNILVKESENLSNQAKELKILLENNIA
ncbi:hypothetical protein IKJ53_03565 [bacterium]|nr:hypothetical protein [bacterium]